MNFWEEIITAIKENLPLIKESFFNEIGEISQYWYLIPIAIILILIATKIGNIMKKIEYSIKKS